MKHRIVQIIIAAATLAGVSGAQAQSNTQSAYLGAGFGITKLDVDCSGAPNCSHTDSGFKVYGGYKFTPTVAAELVYLGLGKAKASRGSGSSFLSAEIKTTAAGGGLALHANLGPTLQGVVRLGVASVKSTVSVIAGTLGASEDQSSTQAYAGLGLSFLLTPALSLDLSADYTRSKYVDQIANVNLLGAGLKYAF